MKKLMFLLTLFTVVVANFAFASPPQTDNQVAFKRSDGIIFTTDAVQPTGAVAVFNDEVVQNTDVGWISTQRNAGMSTTKEKSTMQQSDNQAKMDQQLAVNNTMIQMQVFEEDVSPGVHTLMNTPSNQTSDADIQGLNLTH